MIIIDTKISRNVGGLFIVRKIIVFYEEKNWKGK